MSTLGSGVYRVRMSNKTIGMSDELQAYLLDVGVREPEVLRRLREETNALPQHDMQIAPEQGAFMAMLVTLLGARRCIEVGTFTGYSSTAVALALPADGSLLCCDVSTEWTDIARRYWAEAGVDGKIELRIGPGVETLDNLISSGARDTFDFAFVDADKRGYGAYYDRLLQLVRPGGVIAFDNVFYGGEVLDPEPADDDLATIQQLNRALATDERVDISMLPLADGLTLVRRR
jgi:predicted O-methyltransferase YrrM